MRCTMLCFGSGKAGKGCDKSVLVVAPQRELLVRLYALGWRLVELRGMKWPHCPKCVPS